MRRRYPNELRADMQRIYGVNLDDMGRGVSVRHVAALAACLPCGSLTLERIDPRTKYTETDWLLLGILNSLRSEPFNPFEERARPRRASMGADEMRAWLSRPRREVSDGDD